LRQVERGILLILAASTAQAAQAFNFVRAFS
jgi:hypothetical protein